MLVTINYRLGAPGFLEMPDAPVNRGVLDWIRALEWVHENIAAFGGDPAKVTVAGRSAGGGACAALPGVPAAAGLFRGLICMSGGPAMLQTPEGVRTVAGRMREYLGVPLSRAALEELSTETILAAQAAVASGPANAQSPDSVARVLGEGIKLQWAPWVDGEVLAACPCRRRGPSAHNDIPLLTGGTASEVNPSWMAEDWVTLDMVRAWRRRAWPSPSWTATWISTLGCGRARSSARPSATGRSGWRRRNWPRSRPRRAGRPTSTTSPGGRGPRRSAAGPSTPWKSRSSLTRSASAAVTDVTGQAPPEGLARDMHGAWVRFVTGGDPGWSRYAPGTRQVMVFAEASGVQADPLRLEREAWSDVITPGQ